MKKNHARKVSQKSENFVSPEKWNHVYKHAIGLAGRGSGGPL